MSQIKRYLAVCDELRDANPEKGYLPGRLFNNRWHSMAERRLAKGIK